MLKSSVARPGCTGFDKMKATMAQVRGENFQGEGGFK